MKLKTLVTLLIPLPLASCLWFDPPIQNSFMGYSTCPPFHSWAPHESRICQRPYCPVNNRTLYYIDRYGYAHPVQAYGDASRTVYGPGNGVALYCQGVTCQPCQ